MASREIGGRNHAAATVAANEVTPQKVFVFDVTSALNPILIQDAWSCLPEFKVDDRRHFDLDPRLPLIPHHPLSTRHFRALSSVVP